MIGLCKKQGGLYTLQNSSQATLPKSDFDVISKLSSITLVNSITSCNYTSIVDKSSLWHSRLGHPSSQRLALLQSIVPEIGFCNSNKVFDCSFFSLAKQKRLPFHSSTHVSFSCFDLVHVDIWGPYSTPSLNGSKYFLTIVDYSRCTWVFLMTQESETSCWIQ